MLVTAASRSAGNVINELKSKFPLDADQEEYSMELYKRFANSRHHVQLLPAATGSGKTRCAAYVATILYHLHGITPMVICPANIKTQWQEIFKDFKLPNHGVHSYESTKSVKFKYLNVIEKNDFEISEQFDEILNDGLFLIVDESQKLKNSSAQHFAVTEMIYHCANRPLGRVLHLTASFIDKQESFRALFRCFGVTNKTEFLQYNPGLRKTEYRDFGLGEILRYCGKIDPVQTNTIFNNYGAEAKYINSILEQLWIKVLRRVVVIPVTDPVYKHPDTGKLIKNNRYNGFYILDSESALKAEKAIRSLMNMRVISSEGRVNLDRVKNNVFAIQEILMDLCEAKLNTIIRLAIQDLTEHPTRKVILCIPFIDYQKVAYNRLIRFNPIMLNGSVSIDERPDLVADFNAANNDYRVLIMTPEVGGVGISLHDTNGNYPRRLRIISTYNFNTCFQTTGRIYRRGMKSDAEVFVIYAVNASLESILVSTLAKSKICGDVLIPGTNRVFPGDFDIFIENEQNYPKVREYLNKLKN